MVKIEVNIGVKVGKERFTRNKIFLMKLGFLETQVDRGIDVGKNILIGIL